MVPRGAEPGAVQFASICIALHQFALKQPRLTRVLVIPSTQRNPVKDGVSGGIRWEFKQLAKRRDRDSNPGYPCGYSGFQDRCDRPLCHLSGADAMEIWVSCQRRYIETDTGAVPKFELEKNQAARRCGSGAAVGNASVDWRPKAFRSPSTIRSRWTAGSSV